MRLVHLSDTHFGTELPEVVTALTAAVTEIMPDIVVLSGDITQRARAGQFEQAQAFLHTLPCPVQLAIPGNHDLPLFHLFDRLVRPYRLYERYMGPRNRLWHAEGIGLAALDATHPLRHKNGRLETDRVAGMLQQLRRLIGDGMLMVAVHQPLITAWQEDRDQTLLNAAEMAQLFAEYKVDLVMSGHVHVPFAATAGDYFNGLSRDFVLCNAGTATSWRTRVLTPNAFNVITLTPQAIKIVPYYYDGADQFQFVAVNPIRFTPGDCGWVELPV